MDVFLGRGVTYTNRTGDLPEQTLYERWFHSWQEHNPDGDADSFNTYLRSRNYRLKTLRPLHERGLLAEGGIGRSALHDVVGQGPQEQMILEAEINRWREMVGAAENQRNENFTQRVDRALLEIRKDKKETITLADEIAAVNRLFQSNGVGNLVHAPAEALPYILSAENPSLENGDPMRELGCLVVDTYAITVFERLGYTVTLHWEGNHPVLYLENENDQLFIVDPKTPINDGTGVTEITGEEEKKAIQDSIANETFSNNEKITAGLLYNRGQELIENGDEATGVAFLLKAYAMYPESALINYALSQMSSNLISEEMKAQYLQRALSIEPDIAGKWEKTPFVGAYLSPAQF